MMAINENGILIKKERRKAREEQKMVEFFKSAKNI